VQKSASQNRVLRILRGLAWIPLALGWVWGLTALILFPGWPSMLRLGAGAVWVAATLFAFFRLTRGRFAVSVLAAMVVVAALFLSLHPSDDRPWTVDHARTAVIRWSGESVEIENVRHTVYHSRERRDVRWETRRYRLDEVATLDFILEPFGAGGAVAHTFLSFGFTDGRYLAISVEIRKERNERYSPLRGLFRNYELIYVVGDERDLIGMRANIRENDVYVFPLKARKERVRALLESMLRRADSLREHPEFYSTLNSTCFSNIIRHVNELVEQPIGFDHRVLLPGYSDELLFELGSIDFDGGFEQLRERFRVNARSALLPDERSWSRQIRTLEAPR
jgi:hypothetical protein